MKMKGKGEKGRSWAEEIRDEDLDIAAEEYAAEEVELAELDAEPMPEPYEDDLEERGNQESFEASMAELEADNYLAQYDE